MNKQSKKGFTIVELIIVIAVIGILAAILIPTFAGIITKAEVKSDVANVRNINSALSSYVAEQGTVDACKLPQIITEIGFKSEVLTAQAEGHVIAFDNTSHQVMLLKIDTGEVVYPKDITHTASISQVIVGRTSLIANPNYQPVYTLNDNLQFIGNLTINNSHGLNLGGYILHAESLTINTIANEDFVISNGAIEIEGELIVNGHHVEHQSNAVITCNSASINVSSTTYELGGALNVKTALDLNGESRMLKKEGSSLQFTNISGTGTVEENGTTIPAANAVTDTVKFSIGSTEYSTLKQAYEAASEGATINISAGSMNVTAAMMPTVIEKSVTIKGAGKFNTTLSTTASTIIIKVKGENKTFSDFSLVGRFIFSLSGVGMPDPSLGFSSNNIKFDNIHFDRLSITGDNGAIAAINQSSKDGIRYCNNKCSNLTITNCSFLRTTNKAMYFEGVDGLTIKDCWFRTKVENPDTYESDEIIKFAQAAIDINFKGGSYGAVLISKCDFKDYANMNVWGGAIAIKERGTGFDTSYESMPGSFSKTTVEYCRFDNCQRDVVFGEWPGSVINAPLANKIDINNCTSSNKGGVNIVDYTAVNSQIEIYSCVLLGDLTINNAMDNNRTFIIKNGSTVDLSGKTLTLNSGVKLIVEKGGEIINGTIDTSGGGQISGDGTWVGK